MIKQRTLTLSLLLLFVSFLSHGFFPAEKPKTYDMKAKAIILMDQAPQDLAGPDFDDKKAFTILSAFAPLLLVPLFHSGHLSSKNINTTRHFLFAVFYQSNYVIKPLRF